jgi:hypothetical protein
MLFAKYVFVVLHILCAAAFFGLGLTLVRQARAYIASRTEVLGDVGSRATLLMTVFGALTFVFALAAFFTGGYAAGQSPFRFYGPEFHSSITLLLILIGVHVGVVQLGWGALRRALAAGGDGAGPRKRIAAGVGVTHLLWLVILVLMFWGNFHAGLAQL